MYLAQQLEIKGEINLESVETDSASGYFPSTGTGTGYCPLPPQPTFDGDMGYCPPPPESAFGGDMGYCPPPPQSAYSDNMGYCPPPPQSTYSEDFNTGFGYPSAPPAFTVRIRIVFFPEKFSC